MKEMLEQNQLLLRTSYPKIYTKTEFLCLDGWFKILDHLGLASNHYLRQKSEEIFLLNAKEKFGILFIDYNGSDSIIRSFIGFAERLSRTTCEICGNSAKLHSSERRSSFGKLATLCEKHALEKLYWKV